MTIIAENGNIYWHITISQGAHACVTPPPTEQIFMKRLLGLFTSVVLALTLAFSLAACNDGNKNSSDEKDYNVQYELDENEEFYTLKGFSISEKARKLADKSDFAALAELFNAYLTNGETPFTADTVKTFTVKSEIDGKPVKKISAGAISSLAFIEKIVVPDSVEEIGANAFYQLSGLKEITLPFVGNKVGAISAKSSFGYVFGTTTADGLTACEQTYADGKDTKTTYYIPSSLKTVTVTGKNDKGAAVEKWVKLNDDGKLVASKEGEDGAYKITVYESVKLSVPAYAFYNCTTLETVTLGGEVAELEDYTFYGCTSLKNVKLTTVKKVGASAFENCSALETLDFGGTQESGAVDFAGLEVIGDKAFSGCTALGKRSAVRVHPLNLKTVSVIGNSAFSGCTGLTDVNLKAGVTLGDLAFNNCSSLKNISDAPVYAGDPAKNPYTGTEYIDTL